MALVKKKFFSVELPLINMSADLLGTSLEDLDNRRVKINLTEKLRGRALEAVFKIMVKEGKTEAKLIRLGLFGFYIRRAMRKGVDYVEDSFNAESKDCVLRVKPFLITRRKVSRAVRKALRKACKEYLLNYFRNKESKEIFNEILSGKLTRTLSLKMKKIYPLSFCEIRRIEVVEK